MASASHNHWLKNMVNPFLTKIGLILVSCFSEDDVFIRFALKTYPEHCRGLYKVWFKLF